MSTNNVGSYDCLLAFTQAVQQALNATEYKPPESHACSVILVCVQNVGDDEEQPAPVGCSINFQDGVWKVEPCAADIRPAEGEHDD